MCDESIAPAEEADFAGSGLDRRQFSLLGAGLVLAGCSRSGAQDGGSRVSERMVAITTPDGVADAFFVHPAEGAHPGVVMWPDIAGLRAAFKIMARTLAAEGYAVLVVNQYYRGGPAPVLESFAQWRTPEGQAKIAPMRERLTPDAITRDAASFVAFLDGVEAVDKSRRIGSSGYCMGGPFTVRTAAAAPGRVGAAASLHGGGLVTDEPDSPHRLLARTKASYLFAIARNDEEKDPAVKDKLRAAAEAAGRPAHVEVYAADHGWCVPDSPAWDPSQADQAWKDVLELFAKL